MSTSRQEFVGKGGLQRRIDNNIQLVMGVTQDANGNPIPSVGIPIASPAGGITDGGAGWTQLRGTDDDGQPFVGDASGGVTVATPADEPSVIVDDLFISVTAACQITFVENLGNKIILILDFAGPGCQQFTPRGQLKLPANASFFATSSTADSVMIQVLYHCI